MSAIEWAVLTSGFAVIAWINWYFFLAGATSHAAAALPSADRSAPAEVVVTIDGGYDPATIRVKAGQPVRLQFDRRDTSSCSEEIVFPDFGIRKFLPTGTRTEIVVTPPTPGTYEFMCGMSMLRGRLIAEG